MMDRTSFLFVFCLGVFNNIKGQEQLYSLTTDLPFDETNRDDTSTDHEHCQMMDRKDAIDSERHR